MEDGKGPARSHSRARQSQVPVATGVAAFQPGTGGGGRGLSRTARGVLPHHATRLSHRQLRTGPAGSRSDPALEARVDGAGRSPANQELGHEDGRLRQAAAPGVPIGVDGDPHGEPARRARLDPRLGRRHGPGAQVETQPLAHRLRYPRRCLGQSARGGRRPQPRHSARAAGTLHAATKARRGSETASRAHRHDDSGRADPSAVRAARGSQAAHRRAAAPSQDPTSHPAGVPAPDEPADHATHHCQRPAPANHSCGASRVPSCSSCARS